jgi:hypothetical protein
VANKQFFITASTEGECRVRHSPCSFSTCCPSPQDSHALSLQQRAGSRLLRTRATGTPCRLLSRPYTRSTSISTLRLGIRSHSQSFRGGSARASRLTVQCGGCRCSFSGLPTEWQTLIKGAISKTEVEQDPNAAVGERPLSWFISWRAL